MRTSRIVPQWLIAMLTVLSLASCDTILQYPDEPKPEPMKPEKDVELRIHINNAFTLLGEYEYDYVNLTADLVSRSKPLQAAMANHCMRFTLNAYRADDKSVSPVSVYRKTFTSPLSSEIDKTFSLEILPGDYRLVMWVDYVDEGSEADKYYDTTDFSEIILNNNEGHYGSNNYRDAFYGETTLHVPQQLEEDLTAEMSLIRPMARYTFISDDLMEFFDKERGRLRDGGDRAPERAPELSDYVVRVVYTRYMTCSFNAHTGKPADSRLGVEYHSLISILDDERAQLAFDYIFTNGSETSVNVAMEVIHKDGSVVSRMPAFDVPLKRSHQTFVTGKFLTTKSSGAIGIKPDFDGEFNIEIK